MRFTYNDDIAVLAEDIKRWAGHDARIQEAIDQMLKLIEAEWNALLCEIHDAERRAVS